MVRLCEGGFPGEDGEGMLVVERNGGAQAETEGADVCDRFVVFGKWFLELSGVGSRANEHA